jgi:hypothetical protein
MGGMVAHPGQPLDDDGDAVQGPQLTDEPIGASTLEQGLFDLAELGVRQLGRRAGRSPAAQRVGAACLLAGMPDTHGLGRDAEPAGNLSLADAEGEQLGGCAPPSLEPFTFVLGRGAAGKGWHGPILPGRVVQLQFQP